MQMGLSLSLSLLHPAGHERTHADHRVASRGGLCRELVWKGEVSTVGGAVLLTQETLSSFSHAFNARLKTASRIPMSHVGA